MNRLEANTCPPQTGYQTLKKITTVRDIKRYLNVVSVANDRLLVVHQSNPLNLPRDIIIVARSVLDGLVTALHINLDHPTKHQMLMSMKRHFCALDLSQAIDRVCDLCHTGVAPQMFLTNYFEQSSELPSDTIGIDFAAEVMKRYQQLVLVLRESVTAYTACIIPDEKHDTLRDALLGLCVELQPSDDPMSPYVLTLPLDSRLFGKMTHLNASG